MSKPFTTLGSMISLISNDEKARLRKLAGLDEPVVEADTDGIYSLPHPHLSKDEILRLDAKFDQLQIHIDGMSSILRELPKEELTDDRASKLHHIGHKGQLDLGALKVAQKKLAELEDAIMELQQAWMMDIQSHTDPAMRSNEEDDIYPGPLAGDFED